VVPALFTCLQPFLSILFSALFLGMGFRGRDLGGLVLIIAGLLVVVHLKAREMRESKRSAKK
jgi:drug/metabolite transporter (DMT)-like permease